YPTGAVSTSAGSSSFSLFSSRRRHTRFSRDWSSDVCSSDLPERIAPSLRERPATSGLLAEPRTHTPFPTLESLLAPVMADAAREIGRASCRERVEGAIVGVYFTKPHNGIGEEPRMHV